MANDNPFLWWLPSAPAEPRKDRPPPAPGAPPREAPGDLIRRAQQIAVAIFLEECAGSELTPVQFAALTATRDNPGIDATRVAGLTGFDRTTVSGVLNRLEGKGLLSRAASGDDKRIKLLSITAEGVKLLKTIAPRVARAQQRLLDPLSGDEQRLLLTLLDKLVSANNEASRAPRRPL